MTAKGQSRPHSHSGLVLAEKLGIANMVTGCWFAAESSWKVSLANTLAPVAYVAAFESVGEDCSGVLDQYS